MSESVGAMSKHHFHCTDGRDFVLDREGTEEVVETNLLWLASQTAARLMSELPDFDGWSEWVVAIYDEQGRQVETVPFVHVSDWANAEMAKDAWLDSISSSQQRSGRTPFH
jgi:hypothetical protein